MRKAPFIISAAIVGGAVAVTVQLAVEPDPFAADSSALLSGGILGFALVTAVGLLLSRGRWSLRLAFGVVAADLGLAVVLDTGPGTIVSIACSVVALTGLAGPWLKGWLRERPAADGPGPRPVLLLLGTMALVPVTAAANPSGLGWAHYVLGCIAVAGSWAYSRATATGLWTLRVLVSPAAVAAAVASPPAGAIALLVHGAAVTYLAWSAESVRAIRPLLDRVYGPRSARPLDPRTGRSP